MRIFLWLFCGIGISTIALICFVLPFYLKMLFEINLPAHRKVER